MVIQSWAGNFRSFLHTPTKVLILCLCVLFFTLILKGNLWSLWSLHRDLNQLTQDINIIQVSNRQLDLQLKQAKDPSYLEKQAKDRMDYVEEDELVFVFPD